MTTPNINSKLAGPFKKVPVENSSEFKGIWADKKDYVSRVSGVGRGGTFKERKEQRRSEEFPWPGIPEQEEGMSNKFSFSWNRVRSYRLKLAFHSGPDQVSMTASGRMSGSDQFMDYESSVASRAPPSDQHYLLKIEELKGSLKVTNSENCRLSSEVKVLNEKLTEKQCKILGMVKTIADLKRRVSELEPQEQLELPGKQRLQTFIIRE